MTATNLRDQASRTYRSARNSHLTKTWARFGFAMGGVVYIIIGVLAAMVAFQGRGRIVGPEGALESIGRQPFGRALLVAVAFGLAGYAAWRFIQAISDTDRDGDGWKGVLTRIGIFFTGIAYAVLSAAAFHRALANPGPSRDATRHWTAVLLEFDWGATLLVLIGLILMGAAIAEAIYALKEKFRQQLKTWQIAPDDVGWIIQCGKWGYLAQAIVIGIVGFFLVTAGTHADSRSAHGLDGALRALAHQQYGMWLLGVVALGLTAYGAFMLVLARYRRLS